MGRAVYFVGTALGELRMRNTTRELCNFIEDKLKEKLDVTVLADNILKEGVNGKSKEKRLKEEIQFLGCATHLVAEVSYASASIGAAIGYAISKTRAKILLLYQEEHAVSVWLWGTGLCRPYSNSHAREIVEEFLSS